MIPTISQDEKTWWDRELRRGERRFRKHMQWKLIKQLATPVLLIICCIVACGTCQQKPAKPIFKSDSAYLDSLLQDHSRIPENALSDTGENDRAYDSTIRAEYPGEIFSGFLKNSDTILKWVGRWDTVLLPHDTPGWVDFRRALIYDSAIYDLADMNRQMAFYDMVKTGGINLRIWHTLMRDRANIRKIVRLDSILREDKDTIWIISTGQSNAGFKDTAPQILFWQYTAVWAGEGRPDWAWIFDPEGKDSTTLLYGPVTVATTSSQSMTIKRTDLWAKFMQLRAWNKAHCTDPLKRKL